MVHNKTTPIAHVRAADKAIQTVDAHLLETAQWCERFASTVGLSLSGRLVGLLHDLGKYSQDFQDYIRDISGLNGEEAKVTSKDRQGKIDHATSGAQIVWDAHSAKRLPTRLAQVLSVVIMSHHSRSGMADFVDLQGKSPFLDRLNKEDKKTHKSEAIANASLPILNEVHLLLDSPELVTEFKNAIACITNATTASVPRQNTLALLTRFLFSCLLDADRISTSDFENPTAAGFRTIGSSPNWSAILTAFETRIGAFRQDSKINQIRANISEECRRAATRIDRIFTLQVPTGGGKTMASFRFALHRATAAQTHPVNRIIYVLPYTSILEQNAEGIRNFLGNELKHLVLEHHSNLVEERDSWRSRVLSENWDAPIVFTTSVQFLNALFAAGTKTARRMHQLGNAILIFDEIQALPIKTIHLFNNALNFLCQQANSTAVLCTATLPLLHKVDAKLGAIQIQGKSEIVQDKASLFKALKRTEIINECRPDGWAYSEIADYALQLQEQHVSILIVCNTKDSARNVFERLQSTSRVPVVHLSTNMCPAHRRHKIAQIRAQLNPAKPEPVICVSTQLIEAGVDLDFGCVIRSLAGLDSIIQAAGRCNRHGRREVGHVHVLNFKEEVLYASLKDLALAQDVTRRILHEYAANPKSFDCDLLSEKAMNQFYFYYFYKRAAEMAYPCKAGKGEPPLAQTCTLLSLLSLNSESLAEAVRTRTTESIEDLKFHHAHSTAAQAFRVIDAPTQGILVPYDQDGHCGSKVIADLAASYTNEEVTLADQVKLHKQAQQYTVNTFPHVIKKLTEGEAIREVQCGEGVYYLDERYYHKDLGVTLEALSEQNFLQV